MDTLLSHTTALEAYRSWDLRRIVERGDRCPAIVPARVPTADELSALRDGRPLIAGLSEPIDLLVGRDCGRTRATGVRGHQQSAPLPSDSAIELAPELRIVSPEHLAVQMAQQLTELELIYLLSELMGLFAVCPAAEEGMFQRDAPLTDPDLILAHLDRLGPKAGTRQVRNALEQALVRSGSPRETKLGLRLSLAPMRGGYHLRVLSMNDPVEVRRIEDSMRAGIRRPDIVLVGKDGRLVAIEYHGSLHDLPARLAQDAARSNELKAIGMSEFIVRREQYGDLAYMDGLAAVIRKELGLPRVAMSPDRAELLREKRRELYEELELIDGVTWNGRARELARSQRAYAADEYVRVPIEAYGLD